jgi:predicted nucleic acid-binding protein
VKLVADANVLLSAVLGGRAGLALTYPTIQGVFTAATTFTEVQEYAAILAQKRRLPADALLLAVAALPVTLVDLDTYSRAMPRARKLIGRRDPDEVDVLALALHLKLPLWSNDNDFEGCGVEWYTTAELLKKLGIAGRI